MNSLTTTVAVEIPSESKPAEGNDISAGPSVLTYNDADKSLRDSSNSIALLKSFPGCRRRRHGRPARRRFRRFLSQSSNITRTPFVEPCCRCGHPIMSYACTRYRVLSHSTGTSLNPLEVNFSVTSEFSVVPVLPAAVELLIRVDPSLPMPAPASAVLLASVLRVTARMPPLAL